KEAVDEVLTSAWAMRVGVKNIGDSGVNHGFAKRNSPLLNDKKTVEARLIQNEFRFAETMFTPHTALIFDANARGLCTWSNNRLPLRSCYVPIFRLD
ncbi:hypothetical protein, partial [Aquirufa ecclesiirivi]|uniref:hypothetical protein n=1 Tax=Aquirufa ecclesiirivi TaxID=2715124 RepID=UPI0022A8CCD4